MAIPQKVQPDIKNSPPIGVMGPNQLPIENGKIELVANKYKEPLNKIIPMVIAFAALCNHFVAISVCSCFLAFAIDNDKKINAKACIN